MDAETTVRIIRILHGAFLGSVVMLAAVGEFLQVESTADAASVRVLQFALLPGVLGLFGVGFFMRRKRVDASEEILMRDRNDAQALQQWHTGNLVSFVCGESIALFGFVLRFLSGSFWDAAPFFGVAFFLLLVWYPRAPFVR
jgi:hypothetical protein